MFTIYESLNKCLFNACPANLEPKPRPLDRGKVLEWIKSEIDKAKPYAFLIGANTRIMQLEAFEREINSGRLDVDHIEDTLGMVKEEE